MQGSKGGFNFTRSGEAKGVEGSRLFIFKVNASGYFSPVSPDFKNLTGDPMCTNQ